MNNEPTYEDGVKDERARCEAICEFWEQSAYIATRFGPIDEYGLKILLRAVSLLEEDIVSGKQPGRS